MTNPLLNKREGRHLSGVHPYLVYIYLSLHEHAMKGKVIDIAQAREELQELQLAIEGK